VIANNQTTEDKTMSIETAKEHILSRILAAPTGEEGARWANAYAAVAGAQINEMIFKSHETPPPNGECGEVVPRASSGGRYERRD
jgi:hypothetical protein